MTLIYTADPGCFEAVLTDVQSKIKKNNAI